MEAWLFVVLINVEELNLLSVLELLLEAEEILSLLIGITFSCLVSCRTVGAILSTRGVDCLVLMLLICRPVPMDRKLCTPLNGLTTCKLTVGCLLGPMTAIGRLLFRNCVVPLGGPIAVDRLTCRTR